MSLLGQPEPGRRARLDHARRHRQRQRRRHQGRVLPRRDADRHRHDRAVHAGRELHAGRHRQRRLHRQGLRRGEQLHDERGRQRHVNPTRRRRRSRCSPTRRPCWFPARRRCRRPSATTSASPRSSSSAARRLIATDTAAPFQTQVDFTAADLGTATFTAKAFDAQNNNTTSAAVNVLVTHAFRRRHLRQPDRYRRRQQHVCAGDAVPLDRQGGVDGPGEQDRVADQRRLPVADPAGADPDSRRADAARADARARRRRPGDRAAGQRDGGRRRAAPSRHRRLGLDRGFERHRHDRRRQGGRARTLPAVCRRSRSPATCR